MCEKEVDMTTFHCSYGPVVVLAGPRILSAASRHDVERQHMQSGDQADSERGQENGDSALPHC
jgi:hypothetical protein